MKKSGLNFIHSKVFSSDHIEQISNQSENNDIPLGYHNDIPLGYPCFQVGCLFAQYDNKTYNFYTKFCIFKFSYKFDTVLYQFDRNIR